MINGSKISVAA